MKTKITFLSVFLLYSIMLNAQTFVPDDNFEQALINLGYDDEMDDYVFTQNISRVTLLDVSDMKIADLRGIEDFNNLSALMCRSNQLTSLDVSQNMYLTDLYCENNQLTSLDLKNGNNSILTNFNSTDNPSLACIQVDNETDANAGLSPYSNWQKDATASYSENCDVGQNLTSISIIPFCQCDPSWGNHVMGNSSYTICSTGTLLTSLSMLLSVDDKTITPEILNEFLINNNGYIDHNILYGVINIFPESNFTYIEKSYDISASLLKEEIDNGNPVIAHIQDVNLFIIIYGYKNNGLLLSDFVYYNPSDACLEMEPKYLDEQLSITEFIIYNKLTPIPDNNFEQALIDLEYDDVLDDNVLTSNISGIISITISNKGICDLTGIEDFNSLAELNCNFNQLTSLDVSQNSALTSLTCYSNQLSSLDVKNGNNSILTIFNATDNPSLTCIQIDNETDANAGISPYTDWQKDATASYSEDCETTYVLPDPNFEQALIDLGIDIDGTINRQILKTDAEGVISLNVSNPTANPNLPNVVGEIADLTGIEGFINLKSLDCSDNQLTSLDISQNTSLISLVCHGNQIAGLDISNNTNLTQLYCYHNEIPSLDVSLHTSLTKLWCYGNQLLELDVSNNIELLELMCHNNELTNLDVTNNTRLTRLECFANKISELDVSLNFELYWIRCGVNPLTDLDLTNNPKLNRLECDLTDIVHIDMRNGNNHNMISFNASNNGELTCISVDDELADHTGWSVDAGIVFSNDCGYNTQRGQDVVVLPEDAASETSPVEVNFNDVTSSGNTSLEITNTIVDPGGFTFPNDVTVFNLETTAEFLGTIEIVIDYSGLGFVDEDGLLLLHYEDGIWKDVTTMVDIANDKIYGAVTTLSPFVIVEDIEPPVLFGVPLDITVECDAVPLPASVTAEDNVNGSVPVTLSEVITNGSCDNSYVLIRTWTATDDAGNTASATQTITVEDNTPPVISCPADVTIECDASTDPSALGIATTTDNCDGDVTVNYSDVVTAGECAQESTINRTWTATDACSNLSTCLQTITVNDNTPPVISGVPTEIVQTNDPGKCGAIVHFSGITASDNCIGEVSLSYDPPSGSFFTIGKTTVNVTATDACGNSSTALMIVTVVDTEAPIITPPGLISQPNDLGLCGAIITLQQPEVIDNCEVSFVTNNAPIEFPIGQTEVTWTAEDIYGNQSLVTFIVEVTNISPDEPVISAPPDPIPINTTIDVTATSNDDNLHSATWDWGDGTYSEVTVINSSPVTEIFGQHSYSETGVYTITLIVNECGNATVSSVYQYVVVYDPDGGFVTGGGWIYSPPGAYMDDLLLEGKANFGFVSKYKKGTTVPIGNTEFQFKAGDLNFNSYVYDWLVIAGSKTKFKGEGTINGTGAFGFMISAIDEDLKTSGEADKFRIKIWDKDPANYEVIIYDNQLGDEDENSDPTTEIGGGAIVIHSGTKIKKSFVPDNDDAGTLPEINIYPNPFSSKAYIEFQHDKSIELLVNVYDISGKLIENLYDGRIEEGVRYTFEYKPEGVLNNGMYIVKFVLDNKSVITRQLILLK